MTGSPPLPTGRQALDTRLSIHDDISPVRSVIPGLTRNPMFSWIPAYAGMTSFIAINVPVYISPSLPITLSPHLLVILLGSLPYRK